MVDRSYRVDAGGGQNVRWGAQSSAHAWPPGGHHSCSVIHAPAVDIPDPPFGAASVVGWNAVQKTQNRASGVPGRAVDGARILGPAGSAEAGRDAAAAAHPQGSIDPSVADPLLGDALSGDRIGYLGHRW